jgi:hypothetical protein
VCRRSFGNRPGVICLNSYGNLKDVRVSNDGIVGTQFRLFRFFNETQCGTEFRDRYPNKKELFENTLGFLKEFSEAQFLSLRTA